jgi:hypothetical protein
VDDAGVQQQYAEVDDVTFIRWDASTDDQFVAPERSWEHSRRSAPLGRT